MLMHIFELIVSLTLGKRRASSVFKIYIKKQLRSIGFDELANTTASSTKC